MHAPHHEEVDRPGRDPDGHPQRDGTARHAQASDPVDRALHLPGGARRPCLVLRTVEEEEKRVAAPFQQARPPLVRFVEESPEHVVQRVPQQLCADLPALRESLGERGEPRDVDEGERAFDRAVQRVRRVSHPLDLKPRYIWLEQLPAAVEHGRLGEAGRRHAVGSFGKLCHSSSMQPPGSIV